MPLAKRPCCTTLSDWQMEQPPEISSVTRQATSTVQPAPVAWAGAGSCLKWIPTGKLTLLHTFTGHGDGSGPGSLTLYKGDLYGTTGYGGAPICNFREGIGCGVVFKLNTSGKLTVLY